MNITAISEGLHRNQQWRNTALTWVIISYSTKTTSWARNPYHRKESGRSSSTLQREHGKRVLEQGLEPSCPFCGGKKEGSLQRLNSHFLLRHSFTYTLQERLFSHFFQSTTVLKSAVFYHTSISPLRQ